MKINNGVGSKSGANSMGTITLDSTELVKSIDKLGISIGALGGANFTDKPLKDDGAKEGEQSPLKVLDPSGKDITGAPIDTSVIDDFTTKLKASTEAVAAFRLGLGLPEKDGADLGAVQPSMVDAMGGLPTIGSIGGEEGALGLDGEVPLTAEEELAESQEKADAKNAIEDETAAQTEARLKKEAELAKKNMQEMIGMTKVGQKAMGAIKQTQALKNTVASTADAISVAAASAPPPFNIPPIIKATITGAAQIATIKGQFHGGIDEVPNSGTYLLEKGERVVDKRLNADLKGYMGKSGGGGNSNNTTSVNSPVTLNFAGEPSPDAVYENRMAIEGILRDIYDEYAIKSPF